MIQNTLHDFGNEPSSAPSMGFDLACQTASMLGVQLFSTNLHLPAYRQGAVGRWRLTRGGFTLDRGYHTGLWGVWGLPVLMRDANGDGSAWETWMSLSPLEIESQSIAPRHARGHTVVMGLGMGWVAINIALNPAVGRVSVIERDPEVIALFSWSNALEGLPIEVVNKIDIIQADALEWRPPSGLAVDFLYVDIWRTLEEPQSVSDVRRMQANVAAKKVYYWGQELTLHALSAPQLLANSTKDQWEAAIQRCMDDQIALPLLFPGDIDYVDFVRVVSDQRSMRWPNGVPG